ncbi:unnamed protein product [Sphagnum compactum]
MPSTNSQAHGDEFATDFAVEDIVQYPLPGYVAPASVAFSPDHKLVSYLYSPDNTLNRKVLRLTLSLVNATCSSIPLAVRLRERGFGVTNYEWVKGALGTRLMVPLTRRDGSELRLRVASSSTFLDPQLSADGYSIAYVCDEERFVLPISVGEPKQITFATQETGKTHELAEYIAQSEFAVVDATGIPPFLIMYQGKSKLGGEAEEDHVYPFAGHPDVKGQLQGGFIWASEQTGYHHLEGDSRGAQLGAITQCSWIVEQVAGSNETAGQSSFIPHSEALGRPLDNRGSTHRGLMFYRAVKHKLGKVDVEDQAAGVQWLNSQGLNNVGIYGWSYGGYVAVMALAHCPEMFQCAVASAPVTAWDGYDTHYTEKYMGSPASNPVRFEQSSVMYHVHQITGKLLLVHGMIDENVHFHHTA